MHHRRKHWRQSVHRVNCPAISILYLPIRYASTSNWAPVNSASFSKEFGLMEMNELVSFLPVLLHSFQFSIFICTISRGLVCLFESYFADSSRYKTLEPRKHAIESDGIFERGSHHAFYRTWEYCSTVRCGSRHRFIDACHWAGSSAIVARMPQRFRTAR